ncbi:MAG: hypothetical protein KGL10_06940 [Alphaproteobacteria bacterium]|nr:hypothetical protein [Alphaproteobacteria bacterium]MDE2337030.1 hypothetical protein [Alphaproteobacteria bacterium]
MTGQGHNVPPDLLEKTASVAAQQNAMERGCKFLPHGCRLFPVEQGWESTAISRDKSVSVVGTLLELEEAMRDPDVKVVFIPLDAMMTDADIEKICQRNAAVRTFFREVKKGG